MIVERDDYIFVAFSAQFSIYEVAKKRKGGKDDSRVAKHLYIIWLIEISSLFEYNFVISNRWIFITTKDEVCISSFVFVHLRIIFYVFIFQISDENEPNDRY